MPVNEFDKKVEQQQQQHSHVKKTNDLPLISIELYFMSR